MTDSPEKLTLRRTLTDKFAAHGTALPLYTPEQLADIAMEVLDDGRMSYSKLYPPVYWTLLDQLRNIAGERLIADIAHLVTKRVIKHYAEYDGTLPDRAA